MRNQNLIVSLIISCLLGTVSLFGQEVSFSFNDDISVFEDGKRLQLPWAGGVDAPQVNKMDLDNDGTEDVILFDRTSFTISVFLNTASGPVYAPELADQFPSGIEHWMLLRDFNGDGRKDLFTSSPLGMVVYVNVSDGEELRWRIYHERSGASPLMTIGFNGNINLQVNATDIPAIADIDGDGDLDILVFRFTSTSSLEWHKNMALEETGVLDSMLFVRETQRWGDFEECECGEFAFSGESCPPFSGKVAHSGGKSVLPLDWEGDGDMDLLISEETCDDLYLLENDGTKITRILKVFKEGIRFPAAYYEDIDKDGVKDLIIASNVQSSTLIASDFSSIMRYYRNAGSNEVPDFEDSPSPYLQDEMLDAGSAAAPAFFDVDQDGDQDMFIGARYTGFIPLPTGSIVYYENTGSPSAPEFTWRENDFLALSKYGLHNIQPQFRDINQDGLTDLVFLADDEEDNRRLYVIVNASGGLMSDPYILFDQFFAFDTFSMDYVDNDNIIDLIITRASGRAEFYRGQISGESLQLSIEEINFLGVTNNPLRTRGRLFLADINQNLKPDAIYTYSNGVVHWSRDIEPDTEATFEPLDIQGLGADVNFGSYLWLTPVKLYNNSNLSLAAGTGRGGIVLLQGMVELNGESEFVAFPNPVVLSNKAVLNVRTNQALHLTLVNMLGQTVRTYDQLAAGTWPLPMNNINPGLYVLVGQQNGRKVISRRIVVVE